MSNPHFTPTRTSALERLSEFIPRAGSAYAGSRNFDRGAGQHDAVSTLSPYIRARLITETEVLDATLNKFSMKTAEKFVQEVFWRTYWKGWMELRPAVWHDYRAELDSSLNEVQTQSGMRRAWEDACAGQTGIACFDAWADELRGTGYLHNHARMWFASIWVHTLRLPWQLGADFFLRHLLDGDAAVNTLSWRWVAGLQTRGKHYLARASNIERYTQGRFNPAGQLDETAPPLSGPEHPPRSPLPLPEHIDRAAKTAIILHDEDMSPGFVLQAAPPPVACARLTARAGLSPLHIAPHVDAFANDALMDAASRWQERLGPTSAHSTAQSLADWAASTGASQIVTAYAPVGPTADMLRSLRPALAAQGQSLVTVRRAYDSAAWPRATHGFFKFKEAIPKLVAAYQAAA